jgi:hypothetical protein
MSHQICIQNLIKIIEANDLMPELDFQLTTNANYLKGQGELWLKEIFEELGGVGAYPVLEKMNFDLKINRFLFLYDHEIHFNKYRLKSLKSSLYDSFSFSWLESYKRLCRTFESECLKTAGNERMWYGPPLAKKVFGVGEEPGDLSGLGSPGWKLITYNDCQYDLITRLHGYKLIRISMYEHIMIGGSLKKIDDLLFSPKEENYLAIFNWFNRKMI